MKLSVPAPLAISALVLLVACADESDPIYSPVPPTQAEARTFLDEAVRLARAGDDQGLCDLTNARTGCSADLEDHGPAPEDDPVVVLSRVHEQRVAGNATTPASRILGVCVAGTYTEVAVLRRRSGGLELQNPVYWTGMTVTAIEVDADGIVETELGPAPDRPDC